MKTQNLVGEERLLDLSISVVNWNTKDILRNCLKSIYVSTHKIDYEIFVVDNASSDGSPEMVEKTFPKVKLIRNKENLGFAKANNQVIKLGNGRYILLLNSDTIVLDEALDKMVEFMNDHPDAGAAGCRLLNSDGTLQVSASEFPRLFSLYWTNSLLRRIFPKKKVGAVISEPHFYSRTQEVDWILGAAFILPKSVIKQIGSLDDEFFMYGEEVDLCYRIKKSGWKIYFYPEAKIIHLLGVSEKKVNDKTIARRVKANCYYYGKRYGFVGSILVCCFLMFSSGRRLMIWSVGFLFFPSNRNEIRRKIKHNWIILKTTFTLFLGNGNRFLAKKRND